MALLLPDRIRERWKDFVDKLSAYYNTPGRLAVVRRQFENAHHRPGLDPATFATELGILALRGFSDMKEKARDLMVRNKFIASQQSCDLCRHLDSATPETSIGDIGRQLPHLGESCGAGSHRQLVSGPSVQSAKVTHASSGDRLFRVGSVMPALNESSRRVRHSSADRELLIRNVFEALGARRNVMSERLRSRE